MRVFLTGATGFIGSRILPELQAAGHEVIGLARSDEGEARLRAAGAEVWRGTLEAPETLAQGADAADAVIHTAFDHDFSRFVENCEKDARVIRAMGARLAGTGKPLIITSGTGLGTPEGHEGKRSQLAREDICNFNHPNPRVATERTGQEVAQSGVSVAVVRLPQVHDTYRQGLISPLLAIAKAKGHCAYVGEGDNRWPAAHVSDVARLYRLALDRHEAGARWHAVAEEGITAKDIAQALGNGLGMPTVSITAAQASDHFGWMAGFAGLDMPASSAWTRERLGWHPSGPDLISDLNAMDYSPWKDTAART